MTTAETLSPRQQSFVAAYVISGNATEAAREAGYRHPKQLGSRQLTRVAVVTAIDQRKRTLAVQVDYSISLWRRDLLTDIESARASGSHSAVMKGRELLGRHIGALTDTHRLSTDEAMGFAWLGAAAARAGWAASKQEHQLVAALATSRDASARTREGAGVREVEAVEADEGGGTG